MRCRLGLGGCFLLAGNCLALAFARAGVCPGALTTDGQTPSMAQTAITSDIHQPFDIHLDFAAQGAFHFVLGSDDTADFCDLIIVEIADLLVEINLRLPKNIARGRVTETVNICQTDLCTFSFWQINAGNTGQRASPLTLSLLVFRILANNAHHPFSTDDLAVIANLLD